MQSQISKQTSEYYSLGQFLELVDKRISPVGGKLIDELIINCPLNELETVINMLSSNVHGVMADKRNGRSGRCLENIYQSRAARDSEHYSAYIQNISTQTMAPSIVPAIYAHVQGSKTYTFHVNPYEVPEYEYKGQKYTYTALVTKMMSECSNVSMEYSVPELKPVNIVSAIIAKEDPVDVIMGNAKVETEDLKLAQVVLSSLKECVITDKGQKGARQSAISKDGGSVTFVKDGKSVTIPSATKILHTGIDNYSVLDNGRIAKAYFEKIGLNWKLTPEERHRLFLETLAFDFNRTVRNEDEQRSFDEEKKRYEYTFFNFNWIEDEDFGKRQLDALNHYWFAVVPGCETIVLKRIKKPVPMWANVDAVKKYVNALKKVNLYYCLMRTVCAPKMDLFLRHFTANNEITYLFAFFTFSMSLYGVPVSIEVKVSTQTGKYANKIVDISTKILEMMSNQYNDGDLKTDISVDPMAFFGDEMITDIGIVKYSSTDNSGNDRSYKLIDQRITDIVNNPYTGVNVPVNSTITNVDGNIGSRNDNVSVPLKEQTSESITNAKKC